MRRIALVLVATFSLSFLASCSDDDTIVTPESPYKDLTLKDHVLVNLEAAVEGRGLEHYSELLDPDFVFHFSSSDLADGGVQWATWDAASELGAVSHMFDTTYAKPGVSPVRSIRLTLAFDAGEEEWTEVTAAGAQRAAKETCYEKRVTYEIYVVTEGIEYYCTNLEAVFVVKAVDVAGVTKWRLVEWHDDVGIRYGAGTGRSAVPPMTWGRIKNVYCGGCCYRDMTERDDVLHNLEVAWNERNLERYVELLDDDFVFFFSVTDFTEGHVPWEQWGRAAEIGASGNMFDPSFYRPGLYPVSDIDLTLTYALGDDKWVQVTPPDPIKYPDEIWYEKVVTYFLTVKSGDIDFVGNNIQALFTVRPINGDEGEIWRIIVCRDDIGATAESLGARDPRSPLVEDTTWGHMKALYSD